MHSSSDNKSKGKGKEKEKATSSRSPGADMSFAMRMEMKTRLEIQDLNAELLKMNIQTSPSQAISEGVLENVLERAKRVFELYSGLEVILDFDALSAVSILDGHTAPSPESEFQLFRRRDIAQQAMVGSVASYEEVLEHVEPAEASRCLLSLLKAPMLWSR